MKTFATITNAYLLQRIAQAYETVVYAGPGLFRDVADAIVDFRNGTFASEHRHAEVLVDADAEVCRMGYGEIEAVEHLLENRIPVRQVDGLRIGVLIIDGLAWVFSPTPQVIEAQPHHDMPNAVFVTENQARALLRSLAPDISDRDAAQVSLFEELRPTPEIGIEPLSTARVQAEKLDLAMCPPQKFELAQRIRVYTSYIQFIELTLTGCHLQRHTVSIPKELLNLTGNRDTQERLRATYRLVGEKGKLSSKPIEQKLTVLRNTFVVSLGTKYGNIILRKNKSELVIALKALREELNTFAQEAKTNLVKEFMRCRDELVKVLLPGIVSNPPDDLKYGVITAKPTRGNAGKYLEAKLQRIIPTADDFIGEMKLEWLFKDVTYEMLSDETFQQLLKEKFPYVNWERPFEEKEAALAARER